MMTSEFNKPPHEIRDMLTEEQRLQLVGIPAGFTPRQAKALVTARIEYGLSKLAEGMIADVQKWLRQVGERNPAEGVRLFMDLLEFRIPKIKAAQLNLNASADLSPSAGNLTTLSLEDLQAIANETR